MHRITNPDEINKTGICAVCGPVKLRKRTIGGKIYWGCRNQENATKRLWSKTDKGKIYVKRMGWKKRNGFTLPVEIIEQFKNTTHCQCCGEPRSYAKATDFCIDHCHDTNLIRGFICSRCNFALGLFDSSVEKLSKAIDYLRRGIEPAKPAAKEL